MLTEIESTGQMSTPPHVLPPSLTEVRAEAEAGDRRAQYRLAVAYEEGRGVPANARQAVKWYRFAAQQNDPDAQLALGVAYAIGEGVERDYGQAFVWFSQAAVQGSAEAAELRELVARELGQQACLEAVLESQRAAAPLRL
jgi:hypothetical protein